MPSERLDVAPRLWREPMFRVGAREMTTIAPGLAAWGLVTGVAMVKGLGVPLSLLMSALVFAGTAQLAAVPLIASGAPVWVVWAAALCINLRFVIFSAQWRPYFGRLPLRERLALGYFTADLNYVLFMKRFPAPDSASMQAQKAYFWGGAAVNWPSWQVPALVGIALGDRIPTAWGLAFAGTLVLLGLACSLLDTRNAWIAAAVAACASVAAYALPLKLHIVAAIAAAVAVGLLLERLQPERVA